MRRDHISRSNANDERVRVKSLAKREDKVREVERARVKRNLQSVLTVVEPQPCDFDGCVE